MASLVSFACSTDFSFLWPDAGGADSVPLPRALPSTWFSTESLFASLMWAGVCGCVGTVPWLLLVMFVGTSPSEERFVDVFFKKLHFQNQKK